MTIVFLTNLIHVHMLLSCTLKQPTKETQIPLFPSCFHFHCFHPDCISKRLRKDNKFFIAILYFPKARGWNSQGFHSSRSIKPYDWLKIPHLQRMLFVLCNCTNVSVLTSLYEYIHNVPNRTDTNNAHCP